MFAFVFLISICVPLDHLTSNNPPVALGDETSLVLFPLLNELTLLVNINVAEGPSIKELTLKLKAPVKFEIPKGVHVVPLNVISELVKNSLVFAI